MILCEDAELNKVNLLRNDNLHTFKRVSKQFFFLNAKGAEAVSTKGSEDIN